MDIRFVFDEAFYKRLLTAQKQTGKSMQDLIRAAVDAYLRGLGMMQQIPQPYTICGVPEGRYCLVSDGILLPKRRRGEKFIVKYTQMFEKEF
jgi:hypothetical protein